MIAELTARPAGADRHPWDWYVEQQWVTHRLLDCAPIDRAPLIIDPCCGMGNILHALHAHDIVAVGADLVDRGAPSFLGEHDFIGQQRAIWEALPAISIMMNPPFSFQDGRMVRGLAERFVRRALEIATHQVAVLLPLKWLASQERYRLFNDETPVGVWILTERPSMPPGDQIAALGKRAWARGKVDYMWVLWDKRRDPLRDADGRAFTPTYWIPPRLAESKAA